ncbi:induced myeloid leukemia cell differentiation protein Mcl-1 isoform X2 [Sigmodon hispidus]
MSPEEELDGYELETLGQHPAILTLLEHMSETAKSLGANGSLPSMPLLAKEDNDKLYHQSLEIILQYLQEQVASAKDAKPLGSGQGGPSGLKGAGDPAVCE